MDCEEAKVAMQDGEVVVNYVRRVVLLEVGGIEIESRVIHRRVFDVRDLDREFATRLLILRGPELSSRLLAQGHRDR